MAVAPSLLADPSPFLALPPGPSFAFDLADIEAVRLILHGGSPIDWHRLSFQSEERAKRFLWTNGFNVDDPLDEARLGSLHQEALQYLVRHFHFRFPRAVASPERIVDLFMMASEKGRFHRNQLLSCVVVKTMHILHHLEARELLHEVAVSEAALFALQERRIHNLALELMEVGLPVVHFYGSRKGRDSMVTKLFSKKDSTASSVLDRLRFRVITETRDDIVPVLAYLLRNLFPWNHIRAGQSSNNLVHLRRFLEDREELSPLIARLQTDVGLDDMREDLANEFSGHGYRMINFILNVPLRLDGVVEPEVLARLGSRGRIVHVPVEFQILDQECAYLNEQGENSHANYKRRQRERVEERLKWGELREHLKRMRAHRDAGLAGVVGAEGGSTLDSQESLEDIFPPDLEDMELGTGD